MTSPMKMGYVRKIFSMSGNFTWIGNYHLGDKHAWGVSQIKTIPLNKDIQWSVGKWYYVAMLKISSLWKDQGIQSLFI